MQNKIRSEVLGAARYFFNISRLAQMKISISRSGKIGLLIQTSAG